MSDPIDPTAALPDRTPEVLDPDLLTPPVLEKDHVSEPLIHAELGLRSTLLTFFDRMAGQPRPEA